MVVLALALPAVAGAAGAPRLERPQGWRSEDVPYPPPWARELPWRGDVQIRFPPGWFDQASPFFWSYPVLYWLEGDVLASRDDLEKALRAYDAGLYRGRFEGAKIKIAIGDDRKEETRGHPVVRRSVTIDGYDPFTTGKELTTYLQVDRWYCPESKRTAVLILRSPHAPQEDDPVWKALLPFRKAFACHESKGEAQEESAKSPDQNLPAHITRLTLFGERADFSPDGKRVMFIEKTFGDVYEVDLQVRAPRLLTGHYPHLGYTRALYLPNGDILLSGPEQFDPRNPGPSRVQCFLSVLDRHLTGPPVALGTKCSEGPAVSRKRMHIAWTHVAAQYPDAMPPGSSRIQEADIVYEGGVPKLANQKLVLDSRDLPFRCTLECQNYRPPDERELTFSAYGHQGTDVCGVDLETKKVTNYSNAPGQYDEPEGIFPDGRWTCVESDRQSASGQGMGHVDIWRLSLDGRGTWERLTEFNRYPGYKASNPAVSDDGKFMAFQMARSKDAAGVGYGIFLYDLARAGRD
jgi:hypothetical protein